MKVAFETLAISIFCPNCGHKLCGYRDENGVFEVVCARCKCKIRAYMKTNSHSCQIKIDFATRKLNMR